LLNYSLWGTLISTYVYQSKYSNAAKYDAVQEFIPIDFIFPDKSALRQTAYAEMTFRFTNISFTEPETPNPSSNTLCKGIKTERHRETCQTPK